MPNRAGLDKQRFTRRQEAISRVTTASRPDRRGGRFTPMLPAEEMNRLRTRLPALLSLWAGTAVIEAVLYYLFVGQPYFRAIGLPFAVAVLAAAVVGTWRLVRPRTGEDRRLGDRRHEHRRAGE
jgi:hypothetical protein